MYPDYRVYGGDGYSAYDRGYGGGRNHRRSRTMNPYLSTNMYRENGPRVQTMRDYNRQVDRRLYREEQAARRFERDQAHAQQAYQNQVYAAQAQRERHLRRQVERERERDFMPNGPVYRHHHHHQPRGFVQPLSLAPTEIYSPRTRHYDREVRRDREIIRDRDYRTEDLSDRTGRLGLMSGGLGDRVDDLVHSSTRRDRDGFHRTRVYDNGAEEEVHVYRRRSGSGALRREEREYRRRDVTDFGGGRTSRYY